MTTAYAAVLDKIYTADPFSYTQPSEDEFGVWSITLQRMFYGTTLTNARANRADAERVYAAHHVKNGE